MSRDTSTWRARQSLTGPGPYRVVDGRIQTDGIEIVIVQHCNLRCRACAYLSPILPTAAADPQRLHDDLTRLARVYHASEARVLGGEPLLHPDLIAILAAVRASRISDSVRVITNGLFLTRAPAGFWDNVDEVSVSVYPGREPSPETASTLSQMATSADVALKFKNFKHFRESYTEQSLADPVLVGRIFRTCQMAHVWRCHTLWNGRLYRCPQSAFIPRGLVDKIEPEQEGIEISDEAGTFLDDLLTFLESSRPLPSCQHCLGSVGRVFTNEQTPRRQWRDAQRRPLEELVDWQHLEVLEANPGMLVRDTSYLDRTAAELV